jgi:hypothetical protein
MWSNVSHPVGTITTLPRPGSSGEHDSNHAHLIKRYIACIAPSGVSLSKIETVPVIGPVPMVHVAASNDLKPRSTSNSDGKFSTVRSESALVHVLETPLPHLIDHPGLLVPSSKSLLPVSNVNQGRPTGDHVTGAVQRPAVKSSHVTGFPELISSSASFNRLVTVPPAPGPTVPSVESLQSIVVPLLDHVNVVINEWIFVATVISNHSQFSVPPNVTQLLSLYKPISAGNFISMHKSHKVNAEAPLAEIMLNAKIAAKAIPIT